MDRLFIKLLNEIENFIKLSEQAQYHLTENAIKNGEPSPPALEGWNRMLDEVKKSHDKLKVAFKSPVTGENAKIISTEISLFRSLARWFAEIACTWSTNYKVVENSMGKIYSVRRKIDEKYNLGPYRDKGSDNVKVHYG